MCVGGGLEAFVVKHERLKMKVKKALVATLIALVATSSLTFTPANAATIKAGAKCSAVGATATKSGKTYLCIKSGKKLIWDKGAASPTFDNLDINRVRKIAFAEINAGVAASKSLSLSAEFIVGPSLSGARVNQEKAALNRSAAFWSDLWSPTKAYIGYFTEADVDWVDAAFCSQANYCASGAASKTSDTIKADAPWCTSAFASVNKDGAPFFAQCLGNGSANQKNRQTGPHEYFHWVQGAYTDWNKTPNWFVEGSADYFGDAIGSWTGKGVPAAMDEMQNESSRNWVDQDLCPLSTPTVDAVVNCFKYTYGQQQGAKPGSRWVMAHVSYYMGSQATEAMIAVKGLSVFKAFLKDLKGNDFDATFAKHYGLTVDDFYPKVAKYVLAMFIKGR